MPLFTVYAFIICTCVRVCVCGFAMQLPCRDTKLESEVEFAQNVIKTIRSIRADYMLVPKVKVDGEFW